MRRFPASPRVRRSASCLWIVAIPAALLLLSGCDDDAPPRQAPVAAAHDEAWTDPASGAFHGRFVMREGADDCRTCHADDLQGAGDAPACSSCHLVRARIGPSRPDIHTLSPTINSDTSTEGGPTRRRPSCGTRVKSQHNAAPSSAQPSVIH